MLLKRRKRELSQKMKLTKWIYGSSEQIGFDIWLNWIAKSWARVSLDLIRTIKLLQTGCEVLWKVWLDIVSKLLHFALAILFVLRQFESRNIKSNIIYYNRIRMSKVLKITLGCGNRYWCFLCELSITRHDRGKATCGKCSSIDSSKINGKYGECSIMQFKSRSEILPMRDRMRNSVVYSILRRM